MEWVAEGANLEFAYATFFVCLKLYILLMTVNEVFNRSSKWSVTKTVTFLSITLNKIQFENQPWHITTMMICCQNWPCRYRTDLIFPRIDSLSMSEWNSRFTAFIFYYSFIHFFRFIKMPLFTRNNLEFSLSHFQNERNDSCLLLFCRRS